MILSKLRKLPRESLQLCLVALLLMGPALVGLRGQGSDIRSALYSSTMADFRSKPLALSPDGSTALSFDGEHLGIIALPEGKLLRSVPYGGRLDRAHVAWSPDGRYVALCDASALYACDSVISILDIRDGSLRVLLDERGEKSIIGIRSPSDTNPAWTADGKEVIFERSYLGADRRGAELMRVGLSGGEARAVIGLSDTIPFCIYYGKIFPLAKSRSILYALWGPRPNDPINAVYLADLGAKNAVKISSGAKGYSYAAPIEVSSDESKAIVQLRPASARADAASPFMLLSLADGAASFLGGAQADAVLAAAFSPDGKSLAYMARKAGAGPLCLYRLDLAQGTEEAVAEFPEDFILSPDNSFGGLSWLRNGTIVAATATGGLAILSPAK